MSPMNNRRMTPMAEPGILDFAPGAAAAYSLRNLSLSYNGPVVTVRRSTDDVEAEFTASEVSDGTLAAWCSGGDGFVKTWHDQSQNGRDATQATTAAQPKLISAGVLVSQGGKPAILFDGVDDGLQTASSFDLTTPKKASFFSVQTYIAGATACHQVSMARVGSGDYQQGISISAFTSPAYTELALGNGATYYSQHRLALPPTAAFAWSSIASQPDASVYSGFDGSFASIPRTTGTGGATAADWLTNGTAAHRLAIGARLIPNLTQFANQYTQELIVYASDQTAASDRIAGNQMWYY